MLQHAEGGGRGEFVINLYTNWQFKQMPFNGEAEGFFYQPFKLQMVTHTFKIVC